MRPGAGTRVLASAASRKRTPERESATENVVAAAPDNARAGRV